MFAVLMVAILSGFPVAFSIAGTAILFAFLGWFLGVMNISLLGAMSQRIFGLLTNGVLIAIPLFVLMGAVLEKSRIAEDMLETMGRSFGNLRGGLGLSVVLVGMLLAASTGIVGATVIAMGLIALPTMLRAGYDSRLAAGIVCASGTLGQIIPPSTLLIILSDVVSNAYQQAQYEQGKFAIDTISVGQIFAAALLPGLTMVVLYILYILVRGVIRPGDLPVVESSEAHLSLSKALPAILPAILLILAVLGAILSGIASPTEAASVGGLGAILMAAIKTGQFRKTMFLGTTSLVLLAIGAGLYPVRLQRSDLEVFDYVIGAGYVMLSLFGAIAIWLAIRSLIRRNTLQPALNATVSMTSMIFSTILAAGIFSLVFIGLGGEERVHSLLTDLPGGPTGALLFCMLFIFVLGFFLDFVEITVIVLPLVMPTLILMGHDPVWLSVLIAINLQTSFLTPPFGFSLFYLRGVAPKEISTGQIYAGVAPFILIQIVAVAIIWFLPQIATLLPDLLF
ncbi:TRAP transporter large permease [Coralliovum pocilloporae]|uniref:TRAP transporter large permease n=1 Tax=Coralliovum pocilloporae TaxID=3066369 RepID=UPI003D9C343D